ncbi:MAG: grkc, partial [Paenibacillus sp.]|nr:grkc [Paenibacillus sp.]
MRKILACSVLLTLLTSTGCWDRKEVNDLAIVMATAIDQLDNDRVELSIQIFIPRSTGGAQELSSSGKSQSGSKSTMVHSASGTTVADAMSHLQAKLSRRLFWGHAEVFVFGEARARKGISDDMDYFQ